MSKLLINEYPLMVLPTLAKEIGLNEAIILQQIHYWTEVNKQMDRNFEDGRHWIYNTYDEWENQFPFWGRSTIIRAINNLEKQGLIVSGNYNKKAFDRTKWYAIDYEALRDLEKNALNNKGPDDDPDGGENDSGNETDQFDDKTGESSEKTENEANAQLDSHLFKMNKSSCSERTNAFSQNEQMDLVKMNRPIPETYQRLTTETLSPKSDLSLLGSDQEKIELEQEQEKTNSDELAERNLFNGLSKEQNKPNSSELGEKEKDNLDLKSGKDSGEDDYNQLVIKAYEAELERERQEQEKKDFSKLLNKDLTADDLIAFWNQQEVNCHPRLGDRTKKRIKNAWKEALHDFSDEELLGSIVTYSDLFKRGKCGHKYRFVEFLERQGYEHFMFAKNWTNRDSRGEKITRDDFTYSERGSYHNAASYWEQKSEQPKEIQKPFEDWDTEFKKRLDAYEEKVRGVGLYKENDIKSMMAERESYLRHQLDGEWKKYEESIGA